MDVAHLNLNDEYLPYKYLIGQLILDVSGKLTFQRWILTVRQKNKRIRTVVNKLDTIDNQFRFFKMELIAGEPNFIVEHVSESTLVHALF
jgi:tRNA (guanine37-N1)-methyltransferase